MENGVGVGIEEAWGPEALKYIHFRHRSGGNIVYRGRTEPYRIDSSGCYIVSRGFTRRHPTLLRLAVAHPQWHLSRTAEFSSTRSRRVCSGSHEYAVLLSLMRTRIGFPEPGKTTVYDESQTIDLDNVPLNGGVLVKTLIVGADPYLRGKMRDSSTKSYNVCLLDPGITRSRSNLYVSL